MHSLQDHTNQEKHSNIWSAQSRPQGRRAGCLAFSYSPLKDSVGLISIKLSPPDFPVIRCMMTSSCNQSSCTPSYSQTVDIGPVSPTRGPRTPSFKVGSSESPSAGGSSYLAAYPPSPTDWCITPAKCRGRFLRGVATHHRPIAEPSWDRGGSYFATNSFILGHVRLIKKMWSLSM